GDNQYFAREARIGVGDDLAVEIGKTEPERLGGIFHARETRGIARFGQPLRRGLGRADRGERLGSVLDNRQRALPGWRQFEAKRPRAREMTQHELAAAVRSGERAGVAVDAQDRRGDFGARLAHNQPPRFFAFRALSDLEVPESRDRWNLFIAERGGSEPLR